jgi:glyoxylase-like metal-dependent hydrolase (beta-lactamase superfamily II)
LFFTANVNLILSPRVVMIMSIDQRGMTVPVYRIEYDVDWPPGHVASYLIGCDEPVLIDAGMPGSDSEDRLRESLASHGYELADIEHLVLTHPHIDHIGQVTTIVELADPMVYAPVGVRERFTRDLASLDGTVRENATAAGFVDERLEAVVERAVESLRRNRKCLPSETVDTWVDDSQTVSIGETPVDAIHTPGHQADHCCFLVEMNGENVLISGDMAIEPFRPVVLHTGLDDGVEDAIDAFYMALDRLASIETNFDINIDRVYPGHGPIHSDFDRVIERDRKNIDRMLERTVESLQKQDGPKTAAEVAASRAGDRDPLYVASEVVAALAYLKSEGRIETTVTDGVTRYYAR